ncbi:DNA-binding response regulator [Pseudorhizobium endolithicum]|uniref:DNA-binding response regulator n=1 Tax=Pseudorhizobium endolithicum TaxID=1191678 RepID=A0ABM8PNW5_9HYPH|nr:DNA-binding response regulator [Pseudorhizobium endolithicum]
MTSTVTALIEAFLRKESVIPIVPKILIVEREYLVAMEAERILSDAMTCTTRIATPHDYLLALGEDGYDILVIDVDLLRDELVEILRDRQRNGTRIVVTTLTKGYGDRLPQLSGLAFVTKPFLDEELAFAVGLSQPSGQLDA